MAETKEQEPSIEEILESIRQIISEDDKEPEDTDVPAEALGAVEEVVEDEGDILDLTQKIEEGGQAGGGVLAAQQEEEADSTEPVAQEAQEDAVPADTDNKISSDDLSEMFDEKPDPPVKAGAAPDIYLAEEEKIEPEEPLPEIKPDEPVIVGTTAKLTEEAIARMVTNLAIEREEEMRKRFGKSVTLEDIVKELLRPMLRQWVDKNLPRMVERMIEKELETIVNRTLNG